MCLCHLSVAVDVLARLGSLPVNELAGKPLRYKIGTDYPGQGSIGEIIEVSYDIEAPPPVGLSIAYCNLLDERNEGRFAPYREQTGTARQYDEGVPDASGPGFEANLREQFERRRPFKFVELDNPDAYALKDVIRATDLAQSYGLGVIAKNPLSMGEDATRWLSHSNVFGVIVEKDAGTPDQMQVMRTASGKPDLPCWFVFFGDGLSAARACAIRAGKFSNIGVTFDRAAEEYGGDVADFQLPIPSTQEPLMAWRLAKSLEALRDQINQKYPGRDKSSDGTIGDASHAAGTSDHNPNFAGVVTAMDITDDPSHGLVARALAETLVASRDQRIKYIISNAQIISSLVSPWVWRPYTGSNAHRAHVHISVMAEPLLYDDPKPWVFSAPVGPARASSIRRFTDIVATEFGGRVDPNNSAYDNHFIDDDEFGVALPFRFKGERPAVRVFKDGKSVVCEIVDVGPWNINDPYWESGGRPQAETGIDNTGRRTNKAGIDLTPLAAQAIGLNGLGKVDWEFVGSEPIIIPPKPSGKPMAPTPFNQKVEDCLIELNEAQRPVLEKYLKGLQEQSGDQFRAELIRLLGGTPPAGLALPKPAVVQPDSAAPATPATPAASQWPTNLGVGIAGILASLGLSGTGVIGAPAGPDFSLTGLLLPLGIGIASSLGLPAPLIQIVSNIFSGIKAAAKPKT